LTAPALVFLGVAVVIGGTVGWKWPAVPVAGALFTAPLHVYRRPLPEEWGLGAVNISLFRAFVGLAAFAVGVQVIRRLRGGTNSLESTVRTPLIGVGFILLLSIGFIWFEATRSLSPLGSTLASSYTVWLVAAASVTIALLTRVVTMPVACWTILASAVIPLLYGLGQVIAPGTAAEKYGSPVLFSGLLDAAPGSDQTRAGGLSGDLFRPASVFSDPNYLAVFAVGTLAVAGWLVDEGPRRRARMFLQGMQALSIAVCLATVSRTGLILLASYGLLRLSRRGLNGLRRIRRRLGPIVASVIASASLLLVVAVIAAVVVLRAGTGSAASHVTTIQEALDLGAQFPLIGAGLGNFGWVYGQTLDRSSAQSFPFTVFAESGALGVLLICGIFAASVIMAHRRMRSLDRLGLGLPLVVGPWFYDYPMALDVSAVWLGVMAAIGFGAANGQLQPDDP